MKYIYYIGIKDNYELVSGKIRVSEETAYSYKIFPISAVKELRYKTVFDKRDDGSAEWTTNPKNLGGMLKNITLSQINKINIQINNIKTQYNNLTRTYNTLSHTCNPVK